MDYIVHGVAKSWTQLGDFHTHIITHTVGNEGNCTLRMATMGLFLTFQNWCFSISLGKAG